MGLQFRPDMNKPNVPQQSMGPNNMRYPTPAGNTLPGSGMMSPGPSSFDVNQGGIGQNSVNGGMIPFEQPDVKPRIPPSMYSICTFYIFERCISLFASTSLYHMH